MTRETTRSRAERRYLNRELSWLDFNARVLALASDQSLPLLERLKFCAIHASNLDEFFMVRVAGLVDHATGGTTPSDGMDPRATLEAIAERVREQVTAVEHTLHDDLLPALADAGIRIVHPADLADADRERLTVTFYERVFPVLTPLAVGPGRPFPYISNLSLSLGVFVVDPTTGERRFARIKVPEVLPRFIDIGNGRYVAVENLIADHLDALFPGMEFAEAATFRVTRDADLEIASDAVDDLVEAVEQELSRRRFGDVVRLELVDTMSAEMQATLLDALSVHPDRVYAVRAPLDLADLMPLAAADRPDLRDPPWTPQIPRRLVSDPEESDIFAVIRAGDLLVHHPYEAFSATVERFVEQAAEDPDVLAIKHTIYRTSGDSPIVPALARAAEQGKQAVAMVELTARFDEEKNIRWARTLERAGAHVVHGVGGLKTHAKLALVVRREEGVTRRYVHIGTGNYNPSTARFYVDLGLFTSSEEITADVADLFNLLTGFARPRRFRRLLVAPHDLRTRIIEEIRRCADEHSETHPARIVIKVNAVVDRPVIDALYDAARAGVEIDLIVRGICCLRPGLPGVSEHIRVTSVLGRFLEHSRAFRFESASGARTYIGSADLMPRNLDGRIEVVAPVEDPALAERVAATLELLLRDTAAAWTLSGDGTWQRRLPEPGERPFSSQEELMRRALAPATDETRADRREDAAQRYVRRVKPTNQ